MKRVWCLARMVVIVAALYCIVTPSGAYTLRNVQADEGVGCDTSVKCAKNSDNNCYCPDVVIGGKGCTGCFVQSGSSGCGVCSGGPGLID